MLQGWIVTVKRTLFAVALGVLVLGCEPETITEARDQLNRGGERIVRFSVAIKNDTITIGKLADLTVLDHNILECDPEDYLETKALYTIVGGKIVYQR